MKGLSLEIEELMDTRRPTGDAELRVWDAHDEDSLYFDCFHEVVASTEGRVWAEGNIRIGDYILIVDSDTRIPRVSATVCQDNYCLREPLPLGLLPGRRLRDGAVARGGDTAAVQWNLPRRRRVSPSITHSEDSS